MVRLSITIVAALIVVVQSCIPTDTTGCLNGKQYDRNTQFACRS